MIKYLDAYHDGELSQKQTQKIERHLQTCAPCQESYLAIKNISAALQEYPLPDFPSGEQIAAQVTLCLPRIQEKPMRRKVLEVGWWMIPIVLFASWVLISSTILVSHLLTTAENFEFFNRVSNLFVSTTTSDSIFSLLLHQIGIVEPANIQWLTISTKFVIAFLSNIIWHLLMAVLYLSWIALWWTQHTHQGAGQSFDHI
jgi:hypothetical protein